MNMDRESRRKGTWSTEAGGRPDFQGASESVIEGHRPNIGLDPGRKSNWPLVLVGSILLFGGLGGGAWYFRADIADAFSKEENSTTETGAPEDDGTSSAGDGDPPTGALAPTAATGALAGTGTVETGVETETGGTAQAPTGVSGASGAPQPRACGEARPPPDPGAVRAGLRRSAGDVPGGQRVAGGLGRPRSSRGAARILFIKL